MRTPVSHHAFREGRNERLGYDLFTSVAARFPGSLTRYMRWRDNR
jgi:hypothetical protein